MGILDSILETVNPGLKDPDVRAANEEMRLILADFDDYCYISKKVYYDTLEEKAQKFKDINRRLDDLARHFDVYEKAKSSSNRNWKSIENIIKTHKKKMEKEINNDHVILKDLNNTPTSEERMIQSDFENKNKNEDRDRIIKISNKDALAKALGNNIQVFKITGDYLKPFKAAYKQSQESKFFRHPGQRVAAILGLGIAGIIVAIRGNSEKTILGYIGWIGTMICMFLLAKLLMYFICVFACKSVGGYTLLKELDENYDVVSNVNTEMIFERIKSQKEAIV